MNETHFNTPFRYMDKEKEYYFSYNNIRQQFRETRRMVGVEKCKKITVLDYLCQCLHYEEIGDYSEVEWRAFGISMTQLERMAKIIEIPDEIVRVFSYLSDHAVDVLPEGTSQQEIEEFEWECDTLVSNTIKENPSPVKGGNDENRPYLRVIAGNLIKPSAEWSEREKIVFAHMPKPNNYAQTNLFPFESIYISAKMTLGYANLISGSPNDSFTGEINVKDVGKLLSYIRLCISMNCCRPVRDHKEPIIQTLYVMSVLAREAYFPDTGAGKSYFDFSNQINAYVKDKYFKDIEDSVRDAVIELREYMDDAVTKGLHKEIERLEKLGEIKPLEDNSICDENVLLELDKHRALFAEAMKQAQDTWYSKDTHVKTIKNMYDWYGVFRMGSDIGLFNTFEDFSALMQGDGWNHKPSKIQNFQNYTHHIEKDPLYPNWTFKNKGSEKFCRKFQHIADAVYAIYKHKCLNKNLKPYGEVV